MCEQKENFNFNQVWEIANMIKVVRTALLDLAVEISAEERTTEQSNTISGCLSILEFAEMRVKTLPRKIEVISLGKRDVM